MSEEKSPQEIAAMFAPPPEAPTPAELLVQGIAAIEAAKIGPKEEELRRKREEEAKAGKKQPKAHDYGIGNATPRPPPKKPKPAGKAVRAAKPKKATTVAPKAKKATGVRQHELRPGSKQEIMLKMALAGATEAAICKKLGWKHCRVTLRRVCDRVGAKLACVEGVYRASLCGIAARRIVARMAD